MAELTVDNPLNTILELNNITISRLDKLEFIVNNQHNTDEINNLDEVVKWFSLACHKINQSYGKVFFPALIESMAGSDAICIKDMTNGYIDQSKNLDRTWQQDIVKKIQRPKIDQLPLKPSEKTTITNWLNNYKQILVLCNEELVPMADRLLEAYTMQELKLYFSNLKKDLLN